MALTFRSDGTVVTYQNLGGAVYWGSAAIPSGSIVIDNYLVGVAMSEIVLSGNESGSLNGQMVADADQDYKFSEGSVCRIGEWAYDALLRANMSAYAQIYWNPYFNVLLQDATSVEFLSAVTAGAPDWTNQGTYGSITLVADTAVNTTEWFQLKKNEGDAYYTLWGSFTGTVSSTIAQSDLTGGYTPAGLGFVLTFASVTTPIGGDKWEFYVIKGGNVNRAINAIVLPYVESKVKHLGQQTFKDALIRTKANANTILAGAYVTAKWFYPMRADRTPAQGGGSIQTGKLFFQFIQQIQ
jgi:hypothetical protein